MPKRNLRLSQTQEAELFKYIEQRLPVLRDVNKDRIDADRHSWNVYENSRADRESPDSVFAHSNLSVPLTSLIVDHFSARADDALVGTSPFFRFDAQSPSSELTADAYDKYFLWKLEHKAKTRSVYSTALRSVYVQRAVFLKAVYEDCSTLWIDRENRVLYDITTNKPVELLGIGYITESDARFVPAQGPEGEEFALEQDPTFFLDPSKHVFREFSSGIRMQTTHFQGPKAVEVDYDRILVPDVSDLMKADIIVEMFDKPLQWIEQRWAERDHLSYKDYVRRIRDADAKRKTNVDSEKEDGTPPVEDTSFDTHKVVRGLHEIWLRRDVLNEGIEQDIYLLVDMDSRTIVNMEFTAKMTPDGKHPYSRVSIRRRKSLVEALLQYQNYVDLQFNSESYRNALAANPMTGTDRSLFRNEEEDLIIFPGANIEMKEGAKINEAITFTDMPQKELMTQKLLDFVFGVVQLWLGVSNLAQGDYQALAPANTATGVEATLQEASKIGKMWMRDIIDGLEDNLYKLTQLAIYTLDQEEVYEYMEGDVRAFGSISPNDLDDLDVKVTVVMAPQRSQRDLERNELILKIVERYLMYPEFMRPFVRPAMEDMLETLGIEEATKYLPEEAPDMPVETPAAGEGDGSTEVATSGMGNSNTQGRNQNTG